MGVTSIEWTATLHPDGTVTPGKTWNPIRGCSRVSSGCKNCYAERQALRFVGKVCIRHGDRFCETCADSELQSGPFAGFVTKVNGHASWTGKVELIESMLDAPLRWKRPCKIFVNSMSDIFHEALPDEAIDRVFAVMALCPQHTFLILTKRPERMLAYFGGSYPGSIETAVRIKTAAQPIWPEGFSGFDYPGWPFRHVWLGVSCEDQATADERIPLLLRTPAAIRFVSYEPALGPVDFTELPSASGIGRYLDALSNAGVDPGAVVPTKLDWCIAGFESGPGARPAEEEWIRAVKDQCVAAGTAFFYKQSAINGRKIGTPELDGRKWMQFPDEVRV